MLNEDNKDGDLNINALPSSYVMVSHLEGEIEQKCIQFYCNGFFF